MHYPNIVVYLLERSDASSFVFASQTLIFFFFLIIEAVLCAKHFKYYLDSSVTIARLHGQKNVKNII